MIDASFDAGSTLMTSTGSRQRLTDRLALLSEMTRLRLLRLLEAEELGVGELASILQLPQSTVSRHLKTLLEHNWIIRRSEGTSSMYRLVVDSLNVESRELWGLARRQLGTPPQVRQDDHRLRQILAKRATDTIAYFGRVGGEWDAVRTELFGSSFVDEALLALIDPSWVVADLGCGTGDIAARLAPLVSAVHVVDMSKAMLAAARKRLGSHANVKFHHGDLTHLPLDDRSVDAAIISLVLHHVAEPSAAIAEASRILRPGGRLLVIDMLEHDREQYRQTMGHKWLGFKPSDMAAWFAAARLAEVRTIQLPPDPSAKGPDLFAIGGTRE